MNEVFSRVSLFILFIFILIGIWNFFRILPGLYYSPKALIHDVYTPEERFALSFGPYHGALLQVARKTPDESSVCLPVDLYKHLFESDDPYYKYYWLKRRALIGDSSECQYLVEIQGKIGVERNITIEVHKK